MEDARHPTSAGPTQSPGGIWREAEMHPESMFASACACPYFPTYSPRTAVNHRIWPDRAGQRRRASDRQTCWSEALFAGWQVQDSNLRRHTPTDLQNVAAHALTCGFVAPLSNFRTDSSRAPSPCARFTS